MTPYASAPCACRAMRVPLSVAAVPDVTGALHRVSACDYQPSPETLPPIAPGWRLLNAVCSHNEHWWVTGSEPEKLLALLGCDCPERVA